MPVISRVGQGSHVKRTTKPKRARRGRVQLIEMGQVSGNAPTKTGAHRETVQSTFDRQRRLVAEAAELGIQVKGKSWSQLGKAVACARQRAARREAMEAEQ